MNNLDTVWASLSSADRIVLLGHDRDLLTDSEKTELASLAAAKADRRAQPRPRSVRANNSRTGARQNRRGRGASRPRRAA